VRRFKIPNSATLHNARAFLDCNKSFFAQGQAKTVLEMDPRWMHTEPFALTMAAAWGARCRGQGLKVSLKNLTSRAKYAARMKLFDFLGVDPHFVIQEHEEAGRFVPIRNIRTPADIRSVIADVSVLLHLDHDQGHLRPYSIVLASSSETFSNIPNPLMVASFAHTTTQKVGSSGFP